jgi:hypothetical protein
MTETITPIELIQESILLFMNALRGFLLFLVRGSYILARVLVTLSRGVLFGATKAKAFVEDWQPAVPGALTLDGMKETDAGV